MRTFPDFQRLPVKKKEEEEEERRGEHIVLTRPDISTLVNKILEGLRGDAFLARDIGLDAVTNQEGLEELLRKMKSVVFRRATEEAKHLFRAGQRHGGPLSRQNGESMLSYTNRRKRWWRELRELDETMVLSDCYWNCLDFRARGSFPPRHAQ